MKTLNADEFREKVNDFFMGATNGIGKAVNENPNLDKKTMYAVLLANRDIINQIIDEMEVEHE